MINNIQSNNNQSKASTLVIVTDLADLHYGKNPIECEVNNFLRGIIGDSAEADEIATISHLLNIVEVKGTISEGIKEWDFLPENIERVMSVLKGITLEADSPILRTTYDSVLSVLLALVSRVVNNFVQSNQYKTDILHAELP